MCVLFKPSILKIQTLRNKNKARKQHRKQRADDLRIGCRENNGRGQDDDTQWTGWRTLRQGNRESTQEDLNRKGTIQDNLY